jgi:hypothetical protein
MEGLRQRDLDYMQRKAMCPCISQESSAELIYISAWECLQRTNILARVL